MIDEHPGSNAREFGPQAPLARNSAFQSLATRGRKDAATHRCSTPRNSGCHTMLWTADTPWIDTLLIRTCIA
jgi:hypothetical protein